MRLFKNVVHVAFHVNDLKRSLEFYCDKLGFDEMFTINCPGTDDPWLTYVRVTPYQYLELFPTTENNPYDKITEVRQYRDSTYFHLALQVENLEDTARELRKRGVIMRIHPVPDAPEVTTDPLSCLEGEDGCHIGWLIDPDGNRIEVMEFTDRSPQRIYELAHPID